MPQLQSIEKKASWSTYLAYKCVARPSLTLRTSPRRMRTARSESDCSLFKRRLSSEGLMPGWLLMIANIFARTCSVAPFDAPDPIRERFELALPFDLARSFDLALSFIRTSNCERGLEARL